MAHQHTTPTVITDRNGKITTVHRKDVPSSASPSGIPNIAASHPRTGASIQYELEQLSDVLWQRASSWGNCMESRELERNTVIALQSRRVDNLRVLDKFATRDRNADTIITACDLLRKSGKEPDLYLTERHIDAVMHIKDAMLLWEEKRDNYRDGNPHKTQELESFILYVLDDPTRDVMLDQALRRGAADIKEVMEYEEANRNIHRGILDGSL